MFTCIGYVDAASFLGGFRIDCVRTRLTSLLRSATHVPAMERWLPGYGQPAACVAGVHVTERRIQG